MQSKHGYLRHLPDAGTAIEKDAEKLDDLLREIEFAERVYLAACAQQLWAVQEEGWRTNEIQAAHEAAQQEESA